MDWPPKKPRGFPLTITARGYVKRIGGKPVTICGKVPPDEALAIYHRKATVAAGGQNAAIAAAAIRPAAAGLGDGEFHTLHYIVTRWLRDQRIACERGQLGDPSFVAYKTSARRLVDAAGDVAVADVNPDVVASIFDHLARTTTPDAARKTMGHLRTCCLYAEDMGWCQPVRLGRRLILKLSRREATQQKWRLYTPAELDAILTAAEVKVATAGGPVHRATREQFVAMLWLAVNGGYGAAELSELNKVEVDVAGRVIDHARGKTGKKHVVPLWPETAAALAPVLAQRPGDPLLFRTTHGNAWARHGRKHKANGELLTSSHNDRVGETFNELVKPLGLKFDAQGFYRLKHLANSVADGALDPHATYALFGHALPGAKRHYVQVDPERLRRVVDHMRVHLLSAYLLSRAPKKGHKSAAPSPARRGSGSTSAGSRPEPVSVGAGRSPRPARGR